MTSHRVADPSRAGAVWVTATGALLLFAAAVVFVAVRWAEVPDGVKLGSLAALSGGLLGAGRTLRSTPITGRVLYELGAFLVPVTGGAVLVHLQVPWESGLGLGGLAAAAGLWVLARFEHRDPGTASVLDHGAAATTAAATVGLAPLTGLPAPLVLALGAAIAVVLGGDRVATAWAVTAGAAPLMATADSALDQPAWVALVDAATTPAGLAAASGLLVGAVLLLVADRRRWLVPVVPALVAPVLSLTPALVDADPDGGQLVLGLAALFVAVETFALLVRNDPFWIVPARILSTSAEITAGPVLVVVATVVAVGGTAAPGWVGGSWATACLLAGVGWLVADVRRNPAGRGWRATGQRVSAALALCSLVAAVLGLTAPVVAAWIVIAVAGAAGLARRPGMVTTSLILLGVVPLVVWDHRAGSLVAVAVAAAILAAEIGLRRTIGSTDGRWSDLSLPAVPLIAGAALLVTHVDPGLIGVALVASLAMLGARLDRSGLGTAQGWVARAAAVSVMGAIVFSPDPADTAVTAAGLLLISGLETARLRSGIALYGLVLALPLFMGSGLAELGIGEADVGLFLVAASISSGLVATALALDRKPEWSVPTWCTTAALAGTGLALALQQQAQLGAALLLIGGASLGVAALLDRGVVAVAGSGIATTGAWILLDSEGIVALDAYAAPMAIGLLVVGFTNRVEPTSSWIRLGPGVALLAVTTIAERVGGGPGVHALAAGTIGIATVAAGAWWRQAAPLVVGTATLVVLVGYESLAVTAGLPTWFWLAVGGSILITVGLLMERAEQGPVETGRRVTDALSERFA